MSDERPGQRVPSDARRAVPAARPLYVSGLVAALWCIGIGLAVLTTITLVGWIAAPRTALGHGMPGVFRTAVNFWLVSHHAGFSTAHGRVGLLPLGVLVLPGAMLYRGGAWMIRGAGRPHRPRTAVLRVALALAVPYALLAALLALVAAGPTVQPSAWQALLASFVVAVAAGGLGAARAVVAAQVAAQARGERVRSGLGALLRLLPPRPRSLVIGVAGSVAVLLASGALLVGVSLAMHMREATRLYDMLAPGIVGGALLLLVELAFLPNAVIWGMAYAVGPGFSVGTQTSVSPTGVFLDAVPAFPPLAALPDPGPAPVISLLALAAPFVAGAVGGTLTIRTMPSSVDEAAPLWGFASGALTGAVAAVLTALSGGPLGGGRLTTVGPSTWQVGLMAALEVGISAAIAAWVTNRLLRRRGAGPSRPKKAPARPPARKAAVPAPAPVPAPPPAAPKPTAPQAQDPLQFEEAEPVLARRRPRRRPPVQDEPSGTLVVEGHLDEDPEPAPEPAAEPAAGHGPEPEEEPLPRPRDDPERTETRGGAIYVLRDEQPAPDRP